VTLRSTTAERTPEELVEPAVELVGRWSRRAGEVATRADRLAAARLHGVVADPEAVAFVMRYVDRVVRPERDAVAARQLAGVVRDLGAPAFLSRADRALLRAGAALAPLLPSIVIPLAERRMRGIVGRLVADADPEALRRHLADRRAEGFRMNVNLLGEAVLGDEEARRRHAAALHLLDRPDVDYVSVKVSSVVARVSYWDWDRSVERVVAALRPLFERAAATAPPTFVNLDMEEYHDLELTIAAFTRVLGERELHHLDAGIVLQAYLPDAFPALQGLVRWATERHGRTVDGRAGGRIRIRLVKGANLAMERVEAEVQGWAQAPYATKAETDANYKRCLDWVLHDDRTRAVRIGVASHNLFDVAWAHLLSEERGVADRVEFEMLQGMAPAQARVTREATGSVLLYTPAVARRDLDVAISYLFRRLEESAADDNFVRHLFDLRAGTGAFDAEASKFRAAVRDRASVSCEPRRRQDRSRPEGAPAPTGFASEPNTDPSLPANRAWAAAVVRVRPGVARAPLVRETATVDAAVGRARAAQPGWWARPPRERRDVLREVAGELSRRRGDLIAAMVHEARKTFAEADVEVSEAVDFARWYAEAAVELAGRAEARFEPLGVVVVVPPWNFPVAIPAGGVLAALAAGNAVVTKPAPETPRCAELVVECCWAAGVPRDALQFLRTPDDDVGRHLVTHADVGGVILTGSAETAALFRSWRPDMRLFAETSGKNAIVVTPNADLDLAVADLVASAFGHAGQKCSAASLAICVGDVAASARFRRQLVDAVRSLAVGRADDLGTAVGPLIAPPTGKLLRALTELDDGETWLVRPRRLDDDLWSPGVRDGVRPGSWFHRTECFGPVLGLMAAADLDEAVELQRATTFGLTGGIHSLDPREVERWLDLVPVGNAYVNRPITGAIVQRQPFGGWGRSVVGPGAKAGGPNYVAQLGTWAPEPRDGEDVSAWLDRARTSDEAVWRGEIGAEHDRAGLRYEANVLRYRPLDRVAVRVEEGAAEHEVARVLAAVERCGVPVVLSRHGEERSAAFAARVAALGVDRIRVVGRATDDVLRAAAAAGVHVADDPVTADGLVELLHHVREQAISRTLHRYGNLVGAAG